MTATGKPRTHRQRRKQFIAAWLRSPLAMGAVVPSSRALTRAMAAEVDQVQDGLVVELGAGTGAVTYALLQAGIAPERLVVLERNPGLHASLAEHFLQLKVLCADAARLHEVLELLGNPPVAAIVSSLPLLSMPREVRQEIERQMAECVAPGGRIVQFTYGPRSPLNRTFLRHWRIAGRRVKTVLGNMPPAHVWVYQKE